MKRLILIAVLALAIAPVASAEDLNPPPWAGTDGTTWQFWEFTTPNTTPLPGGNNPYGEASLEVIPFGDWFEYKGQAPYYGWWPLSGEIWVEIPNDLRPWPEKWIWIQITWSPQDPGEIPIIEVETPDGFYGPFDVPIYEDVLYEDPTGADPTVVLYSIYDIVIPENPAVEWIHIVGTIDVTELVIDTKCVPEPGVFALGGFGLLSLLALRRKR